MCPYRGQNTEKQEENIHNDGEQSMCEILFYIVRPGKEDNIIWWRTQYSRFPHLNGMIHAFM